MNLDERMALFQELVSCEKNVYTWCYDADGQLLHSNCPQEMLLATAFSLLGIKDIVLEYGKNHTTPILPGTSLGLIWAAVFEKEDGLLKRFFVIGPVFTTDTSLEGIHKTLKHYRNLEISMAWMQEFESMLKTLPVVPHIIFTRYVIMFHYCLTEKKITISDIYQSDTSVVPELYDMPLRDRHTVWHNEKEMLRMVREGDLNYRNALTTSSMISNGVPIKTNEPLRQAKDSIIVFISLCTRAAIEGGMSPEQAYSLGDAYIQSVEDSKIFNDISPIATTMYADFVQRVRKCRTNPKFSRHIQNCLDYIELHIEEQLKLEQLAEYVGYNEYYLSRRFKSEVGYTISDYIKYAKIERAKALLTTTENGIQKIAEQLGFCSRSYFGTIFGKIVRCSPAEYRKNYKRI